MKPENTRNIDELKALNKEGAPFKCLFFWGHIPKIPGQVDQSCLSNWYPAAFEIDGVRYPTAEHFMMVEKARLFGDSSARNMILEASSPGEAKKLGRSVREFDDSVWNQYRFEIVVRGCHAKFSQNTHLGELLIRTGTKVLVEASPRDRIWGIGMGRDHKDAINPEKWNGLNLLGFALMETRERIKQET